MIWMKPDGDSRVIYGTTDGYIFIRDLFDKMVRVVIKVESMSLIKTIKSDKNLTNESDSTVNKSTKLSKYSATEIQLIAKFAQITISSVLLNATTNILEKKCLLKNCRKTSKSFLTRNYQSR
jgi:hypothetical protein